MNRLIEDFFNQQKEQEATTRAIALRQKHNDLVDLMREMIKVIVPIAHKKIPKHCIWISVNGTKRCESWEIAPKVYLLGDYRTVRLVPDEHGKMVVKTIRLRHYTVMPAKPSKSKRNDLHPLAEGILLKAKQFGISPNDVSAWKSRLDDL